MPGSPSVTVGSKAQVFHGTAKRTSGGLVKADLMKTDKGRIVSKKAHAAGLVAIKRLRNAGFIAKKGEFTLFKKGSPSRKAKSPAKSQRKTRSMTAANHKKAHNRAVKAWATRRSKKSPSKGGFANNMRFANNSRKNKRNSRKNSRRND
jgi:hypothetical protein